MGVILDTNAVSALFLGEPSLEKVLSGRKRVHLPTIVVGEYRYGLVRSRKGGVLEELLSDLLNRSVILPVELATTPHYAAVRDELRRRGTPIPENDVWIAALSVQHGLPVVSKDEHFDRVSRVRRVDW